MTNALDAFASADFDWTRQLRSVWRDPPYHVASLHKGKTDELMRYFEARTRDPDPADEPLGQVLVGPAGFGKTHLVGELRRRVWAMDGWFVLLDFVGIKDFWSSVALGFLNSLQINRPDGQTQYDRLVIRLASLFKLQRDMMEITRKPSDRTEILKRLNDLFFKSISDRYPQQALRHRDVITALVLLISENLECHSAAHAWLQGMSLDAEAARLHGFKEDNNPVKVVEGLSWLMSLTGPTFIAVDQIDAIVTASNIRSLSSGIETDRDEASVIVAKLSQGLMDLHEKKRRAVTIISCLETTWKILSSTQVSSTDRYHDVVSLPPVNGRDTISNLISARLAPAYSTAGFTAPFPTWPFSEKAIASASGLSPRKLLKACEDHRKRCAAEEVVTVCDSFDAGAQPTVAPPPPPPLLDERFASELKTDGAAAIVQDEDLFRELLIGTLRLFEKHLELPDDVDAVVQSDPDQKRPSLHGRLSFTFRAEGDREQHYCFRILGHQNSVAFQSRLKAAMTASGIDRSLKFRHLYILRSTSEPAGAKTKTLVEQFHKAGGQFISPSYNDVRAFLALRRMSEAKLDGFDDWLRARRPLFDSELFKTIGLAPPPFAVAASLQPASAEPPDPRIDTTSGQGSTVAEDPKLRQPQLQPVSTPPQAAGIRMIPVGLHYARGKVGDPVFLKADVLSQHTAILAGSGSGKTVLLRRMIEEAALLGIPSVVLDINNDLSRLGKSWPTVPDGFNGDDAAKAKAYHARTDIVIWTPGAATGNPISLRLLPDFAAVGDTQDAQSDFERGQAIEMALATLTPYIGATGTSGNLKKGVLADTLRSFASSGGGTLDALIDLLSDLPSQVSKIGDAEKLASKMANQLLAAVATNPLLQSSGPSLDPQTLFNGPDGRTRVSVINFSGLASQEARLSFVNQLQMALFTWIKQHPSSTGRLYVVDEAQNFVPSQKTTPCKASGQALVAQARKYGLGMILATQLPKGIDNGIVSSCTTHVYGRMGSQATIDATSEMMSQKGGSADDLGRLTTGEFYFSTDGMDRPLKIRTPLCLSYHPKNPPTSDEVFNWARG